MNDDDYNYHSRQSFFKPAHVYRNHHQHQHQRLLDFIRDKVFPNALTQRRSVRAGADAPVREARTRAGGRGPHLREVFGLHRHPAFTTPHPCRVTCASDTGHCESVTLAKLRLQQPPAAPKTPQTPPKTPLKRARRASDLIGALESWLEFRSKIKLKERRTHSARVNPRSLRSLRFYK